jgi:cation diffusion facilitator family transporter
MHIHTLDRWMHDHRFSAADERSERNTRRVIVLTALMMVVEIAAGIAFGSMALLADGWHMSTHVVALGITAVAYRFARQHEDNPLYSFGTGKVGVLGGYSSAIVLAVVAVLMAAASVRRLVDPEQIKFDEAMIVAGIGLVVNIISAFFLQEHEPHEHAHDEHRHYDHNLKAAYLHVLADAMTSVLAIVALLAGKALGWIWMDPVMGLVGGAVILRWAYGLLRDTSIILLDRSADAATAAAIRAALEADADNRVADLHVWQVGSHHLSVIVSIVTHYPQPPEHYKGLLAGFSDIEHVTVEVHTPASTPCLNVSAK